MLIYHNDSSRFFSKAHSLTSTRKLTRIPILGMISLLLSGPEVQLDIFRLPPTSECHFLYIYAYFAMLVIIVVHGVTEIYGLWGAKPQ